MIVPGPYVTTYISVFYSGLCLSAQTPFRAVAWLSSILRDHRTLNTGSSGTAISGRVNLPPPVPLPKLSVLQEEKACITYEI